jgi:protein-tyrosine phosphatase
VIQVNKGSALGAFGVRAQETARWLLDMGLVHVIASDAHSPQHRSPDLKMGMAALDAETARILESNADLLFSGRQIPKRPVHVPKKVLGFWL